MVVVVLVLLLVLSVVVVVVVAAVARTTVNKRGRPAFVITSAVDHSDYIFTARDQFFFL